MVTEYKTHLFNNCLDNDDDIISFLITKIYYNSANNEKAKDFYMVSVDNSCKLY